jgi:hypothetical protein
MPEVVAKGPEGLPPINEAIDTFRDEIAHLDERVAGAQEKPSIGINAGTMDRIEAERERSEILRNDAPRLEALQAAWQDFGGEDIDKAQARVDAIGVTSDASELSGAKVALRVAKNAFYERMEQESKRTHDSDEALTQAVEEYPKHDPWGQTWDATQKLAEMQQELSKDALVYPPKGPKNAKIEELEIKNDDLESEKTRLEQENADLRVRNDNLGNDLLGAYSRLRAQADERVLVGEMDRELEAGLAEREEERESRGWRQKLSSLRPGMLMVRLQNRMADFPKRETGNDDNESEDSKEHGSNRNRNIAILGALALAGAAAVYLGTRGVETNHSALVNLDPPKGGGHGSTPEHFPGKPGMGPGLAEHVGQSFSEAARTAHAGEGWLNQLQQMGFSSEQAQHALPKLLGSKNPEIAKWVYTMADGNPGVSRPGKFSTSTLESIMKLRS